MNRLEGKTVFITGASAGIGEACARALAGVGANLILSARRKDRIDTLASELGATGIQVDTFQMDVRDRNQVDEVVGNLVSENQIPDALVNNAGLARGLSTVFEGDIQDWEEMIDTNVKGLLYVTRAVLPHMVKRNSGHIVNLGSIAGRMAYPAGNVYNATKYAVRGLTHAINIDLVGTNIRASTVDPGMVKTEFSEVRFRGDTDRADSVYEGFRTLLPEDIADAIVYVLNAPERVNVLEMLVMPTDQRNPYVTFREG